MSLLAAFVLPVIGFLAWWWFRVRNRLGQAGGAATGDPCVILLTIAAASLCASYLLIEWSSRWPEDAEIAWTGLRPTSSGTSITIGGATESGNLLWPTGATFPMVTVEAGSGTIGRVSVSGGGALVLEGGRPLNGQLVPRGDSRTFGGVSVGIEDRGFWRLSPDRWAIRVAAGSVTHTLARPASEAVFSFEGREQESVARLRRSGADGDAATALILESWSRQTVFGAVAKDDASAAPKSLWARLGQFAVPDTNDLFVVPGSDSTDGVTPVVSELILPATLEIRWPGRKLQVRISRDRDGAPRVEFLPPWRKVSPLPPLVDYAQVLTVTTAPRPGEFAFEIPHGRAVGSVRSEARLLQQGGRTIFADGNTSVAPGGVRILPGNELAEAEGPAALVSRLNTPFGGVSVELSIARDQAPVSSLRGAMLAAFSCLLLAVVLLRRSLSAQEAWPAAIIGAAVWNVLTIRLLLAFRFVSDPATVDATGIRGLALALIGLAIVVPAGFLALKLYRDSYLLPVLRRADRRRARVEAWSNLVVLAWLAVVCALDWMAATSMWANHPRPDAKAVVLAMGLVFSALLFHAVSLLESRRRVDHVSRVAVWLWPQRVVFLNFGRRVWDAVIHRPFRLSMYVVALFAMECVIALALVGMHAVPAVQKFAQDFVGPALLVGGPVLLWLALLASRSWRERPDLRPPIRRMALIGLPLVAVPLVWPLIVGDVGGIFATLAVLLPLGCLALALPARRFGVIVLGWALLAIGGGVFVMGHLSWWPDGIVRQLQRGASRYLVYTLGTDAQSVLPLAQLQARVGNGIPVQSLQNAVSHVWQDQALARFGGLLGAGYGSAPAHQATVPQHVLQFDSTFSVFIASDFGALGALGLITIYAVPLVVVLALGRQRFGAGHALALIAAASLLNEALIHAVMNLGGLPFTGRNLPLLSVNSVTDLLRWTIVCAMLLQGLVWASTSAVPSLSPALGDSLLGTPAGVAEPQRTILTLAGCVAAPTLVLGALLASASIGVWRSESLHSFSWQGYHDAVGRLIAEGALVWDRDAHRIRLARLPIKAEGDTVIEQEVVRFNSLPDAEKFDLEPRVAADLSAVTSLAAYDALLAELRARSARRVGARREPLFQVVARTTIDSDTGEAEDGEELIVNPDLGLAFAFRPDARQQDLRGLYWAGRGGAAAEALIGASWVNGRWRLVRDPAAALAWASQISPVSTLPATRDEEASMRRTLTLDQQLQEAAQAFVQLKGRQRHAELLTSGGQGLDPRTGSLPPRVALSVVDLPSGRVVALGGWPRTSASGNWEFQNGEWLPPADWLGSAPAAMARRYAGERNFDRIEMGSASKPLWALSALRVHPNIARDLATRGDDDAEGAVFGIPVSPKVPWHVTPKGWTKFDQYLSSSDNRYHIRLGFLGLAEGANGGIAVDGSAAGSEKESMNGGASAWRRTPKFPVSIRFASSHPSDLRELAETPLAQNFRSLFAVGTRPGESRSRRVSFWTGDEADDQPGRAFGAGWAAVSPEATDLRLDQVAEPRQFVSLLLGGGSNRWANVEFAAEFGTAVTGHPVVAHITPAETRPGVFRKSDPAMAIKLRAGLANVVRNGTATDALRASGALAVLGRLQGIKVYAKTGTLATAPGAPQTSRLVLALVRWDKESEGLVKDGLVFSLVVERGQVGMAARWLGEFLASHEPDLQYFLGRHR